MSQLGNDIILQDGDIIANFGGDLYTADDYEAQKMGDVPFEGFTNMYFALTDRLLTPPGDNVFYLDYGAGIYGLLSNPNGAALKDNLEVAVREGLLQDDRVKSVESVIIEQNDSYVNVKAEVVVQGTDSIAQFVFPNIVIE
jgi:phage baseplate assembly protein W